MNGQQSPSGSDEALFAGQRAANKKRRGQA
jgi:hypothetical protein